MHPRWFLRKTRRRSEWTLEELYELVCATRSDIYSHCPLLRELAARCSAVTELGTRYGVSTVALLAGQPRRLTTYDLVRQETVALLERVAGATQFRFVCGDSRAVAIAPTDLLFIDTCHTYEQLRVELARHAPYVRRYIALHDTRTFGQRGEDGGKGIRPAIEEFVQAGGWRTAENRQENNGLMVLER